MVGQRAGTRRGGRGADGGGDEARGRPGEGSGGGRGGGPRRRAGPAGGRAAHAGGGRGELRRAAAVPEQPAGEPVMRGRLLRAALLVLRLAVAAVLVYAGWVKLRQPPLLFALEVDSYQLLPSWAVLALAYAL